MRAISVRLRKFSRRDDQIMAGIAAWLTLWAVIEVCLIRGLPL